MEDAVASIWRRSSRRRGAPAADKRLPSPRCGRRDAAGVPGGEPGRSTEGRGAAGSPTQADETHVAAAPTSCPDCGGAVALDRVASQYQARPAGGASPRAELRHRGGPLLAVPAARAGPARPADLRRVGRGCRPTGSERRRAGRRVAHRAGHAAGEGRHSVLRTQFGLHVTKGGLVRLLHRTADAAAPAYAALRVQVRRSPVVTPDETGWRVNALRCWLWVFATSFRRRRSTPSATAGGATMPWRRFSWPRRSPACWCGTGGWPIANPLQEGAAPGVPGSPLETMQGLAGSSSRQPLGGRGAGRPAGRPRPADPLERGRNQ